MATRSKGVVPGMGERIARRRAELGLSQARLAYAAGLDHGTIGNIETGRFGTTALAVVRLAAALHVTCDWLLAGEESWRVGNAT